MYARYVLISLWSCLCCFGCENSLVKKEYSSKRMAEVTPGYFLTYREHVILWNLKYKDFGAVHALPTRQAEFWQKDTHYLAISWKGVDVFWGGVGVPVTLRAYDGTLYLIVFDRDSDSSKIRFRYFRQDSNIFREISPADFPKEIATQNLWIDDDDELKAALQLDVDTTSFRMSLTAHVWYQLETGKEYFEIPGAPVIDAGWLRDYLKKHQVQKLTKIVP